LHLPFAPHSEPIRPPGESTLLKVVAEAGQEPDGTIFVAGTKVRHGGETLYPPPIL
jgi:hypothetical protein